MTGDKIIASHSDEGCPVKGSYSTARTQFQQLQRPTNGRKALRKMLSEHRKNHCHIGRGLSMTRIRLDSMTKGFSVPWFAVVSCTA
jgi:hypothetical protein